MNKTQHEMFASIAPHHTGYLLTAVRAGIDTTVVKWGCEKMPGMRMVVSYIDRPVIEGAKGAISYQLVANFILN